MVSSLASPGSWESQMAVCSATSGGHVTMARSACATPLYSTLLPVSSLFFTCSLIPFSYLRSMLTRPFINGARCCSDCLRRHGYFRGTITHSGTSLSVLKVTSVPDSGLSALPPYDNSSQATHQNLFPSLEGGRNLLSF